MPPRIDVPPNDTPPDGAARMDAILRAVAVSTGRLLAAGQWDARIDGVLAELGEATGVDRAYVFQVEHDDRGVLCASQRHEWVGPDVEPQIANPALQQMPFVEAGFARWAEVLEGGWPISGRVSSFPEDERDLLRAQGICSLAVVPIHVDHTWWGFMGFDAIAEGHRWSRAELDALTTTATCIGAALAKERLVTELRQSRLTHVAALRREREAVHSLRDLDRMKTTFIDAVSHELRTPLHNVLGMIATLREYGDRLDTESFDDLLERLERNGHRLERLVTDLLDLSRLHQDEVQLQVRDVRLHTFVESVVGSMEVVHGRPVAVEAEEVTCHFDPTIAEQILEQLLENAVVHTGAGTRIWVEATSFRGGVRFTVADDGPGVPREHAEAIFQPFEHGVVHSPHSPGTGVGLGLVARFAALHGGAASCRPRPAGGAVFEVTLPTPVREMPPAESRAQVQV